MARRLLLIKYRPKQKQGENKMNNEQINQFLTKIETHSQDNKRTSDRYKFVPTTELAQSVLEVFNKVGIDNASSRLIYSPKALRGTAHALEYTLPNTVQIIGDDVKPRITIVNSYNGEKALTVLCGMFRIVCLNGLVVGPTLYSERMIHVQGHTIDAKLQAFQSQVENALNWMQNDLAKSVSEYTSLSVTQEQQIKIVQNLGFSKALTERLELRFKNSARLLRLQDQALNVWSTYNVINEVMRSSVRSPMANLTKNIHLMDRVKDLALTPDLDFKKAA